MMYHTYAGVNITQTSLSCMKNSAVSLAGIGDVSFVSMINMEIWSGATILCSWPQNRTSTKPCAMYLVDLEGEVYQFAGAVDALMFNGVVFDLTTPYSSHLNFAENVMMLAIHEESTMQWWNEFIEYAIVANLKPSNFTKHAVLIATNLGWSSDVIEAIKAMKVKSSRPVTHKIKRLHSQGD